MNATYSIPVIAYFLGSIPSGYLLVRLSEGTDIRSAGSGNIGATNVYRKNRWAGLLTLLFDGGKGYLAVAAAGWVGGDSHWQVIAALGAILGHMFTVFLGFKGGKGVATAAGAYLAVSPAAVGSALALFVAVAAATRYVSLGSIMAAASFPVLMYLYGNPLHVLVWSLIGSVLIIAKHHENIRRLCRGSENRFVPGGRS